MIDYVFAVVVGVLSAAAVGYAYRAARSAEEVLRKLETWESAWRRHYAAPGGWARGTEEEGAGEGGEEGAEGQPPSGAGNASPRPAHRQPNSATPRGNSSAQGGGELDYVAVIVKKVECAGELMKTYGGCAPIEEVREKCGLGRAAMREFFMVKQSTGEVCLKAAWPPRP